MRESRRKRRHAAVQLGRLAGACHLAAGQATGGIEAGKFLSEKKKTGRGTIHRRGPGVVGRLVRGIFRLLFAFAWRAALILAVIVAGATGYYFSVLPPSEELFDGRGVGSVTMRDVDGDIFAWRGEQYGGEVRVDEVSPHLVHAVIAAEDRRFFDHSGIDPRGIARAIYVNARAGRVVQGGSTITQQVAKLEFLDAGRDIERKLKEVPIALALELKYTKEEILSVYLNRAYLGAGTYGFEAAAQRYFGKSARVLSPAEAAMLAGLLRAPSRYAPTNDLALAQGRASVIIRLMEEQGYLTEAQTLEALANPADLSDAAAARAGGAFADWVMEEGAEDRFLELLEAADVEIDTTFDPAVQQMAEAALADVFDGKVKEGSEAQAAIVVMTHDGAVRAMVGGREKGAAQFNRATQALRQTGSAFKPIVYAAGLEAGLSPLDIMEDRPVTIDGWSPSNYTNDFRGPMTLREALAQSINTIAVRVSERAGRDRVRELAGRFGLSSPIAPGPAIALGTSEARLIEMTGVFATIANGGRLAEPYGVAAIRLRGDSRPIDRGPAGAGEQVISPRTAGLLTGMLKAVVEEGTGRRARLAGWEAAGKTGTTQAARDAWFIGFTADYVAGVWMGYDDNRPLTGVTGGGLPAEIWREVMTRLHEGRAPRPLNLVEPDPSVMVQAPVSVPAAATVVERVFHDVLRGLGAEARPNGDWKPQAGSDR
jgi:penicillin-binding protein 1A